MGSLTSWKWTHLVRAWCQLAWLVLGVVAALGWASAAQAQTTQYTNSTSAAINDNSCINQTFTVGATGTITDVNIGVALTHTYRSDLTITIASPVTTVTLMSGNGGSGDNLSDLFDDAASASISTHSNTATDSTAAVPPYSHSYIPVSALSAFNGTNPNGTWTLRICDNANADTGTFTRADLYITTGTVTTADLSLAATLTPSSPQYGAQATYTLTVASSATSGGTATGVAVTATLPAGFVVRSSSGTGTYNSGTGVWTVGSLAPGATATMTIQGANNTTSGTVVTNTAQITASSLPDPDSFVNNGVTTEDDYASASYTTAAYFAAGTPPTFTCSNGSSLFDWDTQTWTNGATSGSWTVGGIPIALNITGNTNRFVTDPSNSTQTPYRGNSTTNSGNGNTLIMVNDFASNTEGVTGTWTFTNGVAGLRFTIADVDHYYGQFSDKITITGSYLGVSVTPTLTNGSTNTVVGNTATSFATAANTDAAANLIVTFSQPVDTVTITYAPDAVSGMTDPGIQGIGLMDMTFCSRATDLSLSKTVSNSTPLNGSSVAYTLTVQNNTTKAMSASGITVSDVLPAGFTFSSASGTGTYNSSTGVWTVGSIAAGSTASITINGTASGSNGTVVTNNAQITASSLPDPDSTVNNGVTSEDDYASVAFTISTASIAVSKVSSVISDPVNGTTNPKAIPGAVIEYCILVSNTGTAALGNIVATDVLPGNFSYTAGSMTSGTSCAAASTAEDDNNTGADESDPFGAAIAGSTITATASTLGASSGFALKFRGTVN